MKMDDKDIDKVIRRKVQKAVEQSLSEAWEDPFWAQLEDLEDDMRAPPIDVQNHADHFLIVAEMPGVPKDQVDIKVSESIVELSGENALECDIDAMETAYLCNERATTSFHRKVPLPSPVSPEGAEASMKLGVLTLKLPKKAETEGEAVTVGIK
jgi:HSP20 family protein